MNGANVFPVEVIELIEQIPFIFSANGCKNLVVNQILRDKVKHMFFTTEVNIS